MKIRTLDSEDLGAARKASGAGDRLCAEYRSRYQPGPHRNCKEFVTAALAYREVLAKYPQSEVAVYCHGRLSGLYKYTHDYSESVRLIEQKARLFAGTVHEAKAYWSLGFLYLQGHHNPAKAIAWFSKAKAIMEAMLLSADEAVTAEQKSRRAQLRWSWEESVQQGLDRCQKELAARAEADKTPWAAAVEGVQSRIRPDKRTWPAGKLPGFRADLQNVGARDLGLPYFSDVSEVQVDGRWYVKPAGRYDMSSPLGPDCQRYNIRVVLGRHWRGKAGRKPLTLTPGRHVVRVAFLAHPVNRDRGKPVRAESNAVEIEVVPEGGPKTPAPAGE